MPPPLAVSLLALILAAPSGPNPWGVHVALVGSASVGMTPGGNPDDQPVWLRGNLPVWRYGGSLELDLLRGVASSLQFAVPVVLVSSRLPFASEGMELGGLEVVPELRARIRIYTHLDVLIGAGLGLLFIDNVIWQDGQPQVSHVRESMAWSLSLGVEWAFRRSFGLRFGPSILSQDTGPLYLALAAGVTWSP